MKRIDAVHFRAEHGDECRENVGITRSAARAENAFRFIDEQERQIAFAPFLAGGRKNLANDPLRFAHPHVEDLGAFDVHEIFFHVVAGFFAELFGQVVSGRLADERFAAAGRAVKEKPFRCRVLKFFEKLGVDERQLDRILDRLQRLLLPADFFPRKLRHVVEVMFARLRMGEQLEGDAIIRIDPHLIAGFEARLHQLGGTLEDQRLQPMFGTHAEAIRPDHLGNFRDGPRGLEAKIAHDHVGFVH